MSEFTPIKTQEEFDKAIAERIKREQESAAKKYADYDAIKSKNAEYEQQIAEYSKKLDDANAKIAGHDNEIAERDTKIKGYESDSVKTRIAHEIGIPYELAGRLSGNDEDSIRKDAENLSKVLAQRNKPTAPLASSEPANIDSKTVAYKTLLSGLKEE